MPAEYVPASLQVREEHNGVTLVFHDGQPQPLEISMDRLATESLVYDLIDALRTPPVALH